MGRIFNHIRSHTACASCSFMNLQWRRCMSQHFMLVYAHAYKPQKKRQALKEQLIHQILWSAFYICTLTSSIRDHYEIMMKKAVPLAPFTLLNIFWTPALLCLWLAYLFLVQSTSKANKEYWQRRAIPPLSHEKNVEYHWSNVYQPVHYRICWDLKAGILYKD